MTSLPLLVRARPTAIRRAVFSSVALAAAALTACGGGSDGPTEPPPPVGGVNAVSVSPNTSSVVVGGTVTLTATPTDASGNVVSGQTINWSSDATGVATVNASGVVTGVAPGTANVTATVSGKSSTAVITVKSAPVASVTLAASQTSLLAFVADSIHLGTASVTATLKDAAGNVLTGRTITWASSDTNVAQVNSNGVVEAIGGGTATITATSEGVAGTVGITVTVPAVAHISVSPAYDTVHVGQTATLTVRVYDANMNEIVPVSHNRRYGSLIQTTITQSGDVISPDATYGNVFHGDNPGDAVVTFADLTGGVGIRARITVIP